MSAKVTCHSTAVVDSRAQLGESVDVGPYAIIHRDTRIGDGCRIGASAVVESYTTLGSECVLFPHACVGTEPQDLKFNGEVSYLEAGERNVFREFVTVNRGTAGGGSITRIGSDNLFMACSHVAHDCQIGSHTIFGNSVALAGHVTVHDFAIVNAFSGIQQFCRVGSHVYLAAYSGVTKDVVPYAKIQGNHVRVLGLNSIGLRRRGVGRGPRRELRRAFGILFRSQLNTTQALEAIADESFESAEVATLISFIRDSELGIVK